MIFNKRRAIVPAIVLSLALLSTWGLKSGRLAPASAEWDEKPLIILDAGHEALRNTIDQQKQP